MKVKVTKTSVFSPENKPCEGVTKEIFDRLHIRTCTEKVFNEKFSAREGLWRSKGFDHGTYNDGKWIKRYDKDDDCGWFCEIDCIESFIKKHGRCVINEYSENGATFEIEIYNDYRE